MIIKNETIKKNQPMPCICEICGNINAVSKKEGRDINNPSANKCFKQRERPMEYQPFTNSKRKLQVECQKFSHMRTLKMW